LHLWGPRRHGDIELFYYFFQIYGVFFFLALYYYLVANSEVSTCGQHLSAFGTFGPWIPGPMPCLQELQSVNSARSDTSR
jgi:hypothetical protein